jgi:hypothetical protein
MGFLGSLLGTDQAKDLKRAKKASDKELQSGYDEAQPFYDQAFDLFSPFAQQGQEANKLYGQAIGLGSPEEQAAAQARYTRDPIQQSILGDQSNRLLKQLNARGSTYGGTAALAGARVGRENYNGWLDRLDNQAGAGFGATSSQAGLRSGQGDMRFGLGVTKAGQETSFGNAMAENRSTGINNLLKIGETAGKIFSALPIGTPSDIRLKRNIERIGELASGLPVYSFKYIWSDDEYQGVMAHEAERLYPDAVAIHPSGYKMVDYARIS